MIQKKILVSATRDKRLQHKNAKEIHKYSQ